MNYQTFKLDANFIIEILPASLENKLSPSTQKTIENIWLHEKRARHIFNGRILDVLAWNPPKLTGRFVEYKSYIAQLRDPTLRQELPIHILGLTGITQWQEQFLIGCRAAHVTLYPCYYEFAPAGGMDDMALEGTQACVVKQIGIEIEEELGISPREIIEIKPIVLLRETHTGDYEICAKITLDPGQMQKKSFPTSEYTSCIWLSSQALKQFMEKKSDLIVPLAKQLLKYAF